MKNIFFLFIPLFFLLFSSEIYSQNRRTIKADNAFKMKQYSAALEHYKKAYKKAQRKDKREATRILFQTGLCYKFLNEPRRAETFLRRAIRGNYPDPIAIFYLAEVLMQNEKYEDALAQFKIYSEKVPDDWRGAWGIKTIEASQFLRDNPGLYEVNLERVFNSRNNDFTPAFGDSRNSILIFASSRDGAMGSKKDPWTGQKHTSLFVSFLDRKGVWSNPSLLDEGPVNTEFNEGAPSVNSTGTVLYFTRCQSVPNANLGCRIYASERKGAEWGDPVEIKLAADSIISVGHPAISIDDMRLYFVSDMPGGQGGRDIWYAERGSPNGEFKDIRNLGSVINTPGDEMFPHIREDGALYFSSNGHPGLGGLDIFFSKPNRDSWSQPENIGTPINSAGDDFGITFRKGANSGFFTSSRVERGARGDAIYSFNLAPVEFTLQGTVRDDSTKVVLPGVQVQLVGSDGTFTQTETSNTGVYRFDNTRIKSNTSYDILVSKEKFFNARGQETTVGIVRSRDFVYDFYLAAIPEKPIMLPEILYDFGRWELLPQYRDSLNGLINTLKDNPGLIIELQSHTDSRGSDAVNDTLSQRRAQSVVEYLIANSIDSRRLVARGYGKRVPRVIEKTIVRLGFTFTAGTVLSEQYINALPSEQHRDVAHQLNRRTEFRVISDMFDERQRK